MKKAEKNEKIEQNQDEIEQGQDSEDQQAEGGTGIIGISGVLEILESKETPDNQKARIITLLKRSDTDIFNSSDTYLKQLLGIVQSKVKHPILPKLLRTGKFDIYQLVVARIVYSDKKMYLGSRKDVFQYIDAAMSKCKDEIARTYYQAQRENWNISSSAFKEALRLLDIDPKAEAEAEKEKEKVKNAPTKKKAREYTKLPHVHDILNKEEGENQKTKIIELLKRPDIFAGGKANRRAYLGIIKASHGSEETVVLPRLLRMKRFDLYQLFVAKIVYSDLYSYSHQDKFSTIHEAMLMCEDKEARQFYETQCANWNLNSPAFTEALEALDIPEDNSEDSTENNKSKKGKKKKTRDASDVEESKDDREESSLSVGSEWDDDGEGSPLSVSSESDDAYEAKTKKEAKKATPSKKIKAEKEKRKDKDSEKEPRSSNSSRKASLPPIVPMEPEMKQKTPYNPMNLTDLKPISRAAIILRDQYFQTRCSSSSSSSSSLSSSNMIDDKTITGCFVKIKNHYQQQILSDHRNKFEKAAKGILDTLQKSAAPDPCINQITQELEKIRKNSTIISERDPVKTWALVSKEQDSKFIQNTMKDDLYFRVLKGIYILNTSQYTDNESKITLRQAVVFVWSALTQGDFLIKPAGQTIEKVMEALNSDFYQMLCTISDLRTDIPNPDFVGAFNRVIETLSKVHTKISICSLSKENIPELIIKFYNEKFETSPPNIQQSIAREIFVATLQPTFANKPLEKLFKQQDWYIEFMKTVDQSIQIGLFTKAEVDKTFADLSSLANMKQFPGLHSLCGPSKIRSSSSSTTSFFSPPAKPKAEPEPIKEEKAPTAEKTNTSKAEKSEELQATNHGNKEETNDAALAQKFQDEINQEMMGEEGQSETEEKEREYGQKEKRRNTDSGLFGSGKKAKSEIGEVTAHANQLIQYITNKADEAKQNNKGLISAFNPFFGKIRKAPTIDKINEVIDQIRQAFNDPTDHLYKEAERAGVLSNLLQDPNLFPNSASGMQLD